MTALDLRCPSCNAHVTADAQWCTLCYAELRPAAEAPAQRGDITARGAAVDDIESLTYADHASALTGGDADAEAEAARQAEIMLAKLAVTDDAQLLALGRNFQSNSAKVALIAGGSIVVLLVLFGLMFLIGSQIDV